ncbi:protein-glutamate O-methyltransferase CheR [Anaeromyxobacter sp. Fw109-5]|uniref:CheR family methyltransferase n=1 Tax=Anaeromyxobacter sp. (strain Fw109-5) TaxID=404589 RepID=UPI0000ED7787|nr:protein-glutamate O-methyltransferase CheR [Anaeromyxobacter sp. Fw109-5]ABS24755.1 Protein-glutamate O-methyltransferase [Anaeromyxobacter sp. Fw109-5]
MRTGADEDAAERGELEALLEAIHRRYGHDFRGYARSSVARRLREVLRAERAGSFSELQALVLRDPAAMERMLSTLCVHVTSMFRDPTFYLALRQKVLPALRRAPLIRVWHAGCASGEEAYSAAILLDEEGLLERSRIYATDLAPAALETARAGVYPADLVQEYTANYLRAGGQRSLSDHYVARYDSVILKERLRRRIVFSRHDLVTGDVFNDFHLVLCRNVLIYFEPPLQGRVHRLLLASLRGGGFLGLGRSEALPPDLRDRYEELDAREHLYRRREP